MGPVKRNVTRWCSCHLYVDRWHIQNDRGHLITVNSSWIGEFEWTYRGNIVSVEEEIFVSKTYPGWFLVTWKNRILPKRLIDGTTNGRWQRLRADKGNEHCRSWITKPNMETVVLTETNKKGRNRHRHWDGDHLHILFNDVPKDQGSKKIHKKCKHNIADFETIYVKSYYHQRDTSHYPWHLYDIRCSQRPVFRES